MQKQAIWKGVSKLPKQRFKNNPFGKKIDNKFSALAESDNAKIVIYGDIGESWWDDDTTSAKDIEKALNDISADVIHVHINSYGGDVFDGIAIHNQLKNHSAKIIVHVDGVAASAASLIAMAGDEIIMNTGSMLMIHEASTWCWGTKTDIQKTLNALEGIDKSIADIYMLRFKGTKEDVEMLIVAETWLTSDEAVVLGFADKIGEDEPETVEESDEEELDPVEVKNSILAKLQNQQPKQNETPKQNILAKFKRNSTQE